MSAWRLLFDQFKSPLIYVLLAAMLVTENSEMVVRAGMVPTVEMAVPAEMVTTQEKAEMAVMEVRVATVVREEATVALRPVTLSLELPL